MMKLIDILDLSWWDG